MLKLTAPVRAWSIDLGGGAMLHLRGMHPADVQLARSAAAVFAQNTPPEDAVGIFSAAFTQTLLARLLERWDGIGDAAGNAVPVTADNVSRLLMQPVVYGAVHEALVGPLIVRIDEKNASAPSLNGTSPGASKAEPEAAEAAPIAGNA